jgi:hypothetical protein
VKGVPSGACAGEVVAAGVNGELAGGVDITDAGVAVGSGISVGVDVGAGAGVSSTFISSFIGKDLPSRAMIAHTVI